MPEKTEKKWIVFIDDDEDSIQLVAFMFIERDQPVAAFTSGAEALKFLKMRPGAVKCVITDLALPVLDGLTIVEQIRLNERTFGTEGVPVAFYTAYLQQPNDAAERVAEKCRVERVFHKPEDTAELPDKIEQWLAERNKESIKTNAV